MRTITAAQAEEIARILTEECGAKFGRDLVHFVSYVTDPTNWFVEWRFGGELGYGGKFYHTEQRTYVSCYPEDMTVVRGRMVVHANARIDALFEQETP